MYTASKKISGFHGTYPKHKDSIFENNFFESEHHDMWIGDGVYFFIDGIGADSPISYAKQFAIDQCYSKGEGRYTENEVSVLEATIKVNEKKLLDLTDEKGGILFNTFRDNLIKKMEETGKVSVGGYEDHHVFRIMREAIDIEFVKANVYIKFGVQRIKRFESNVPNVTIFVVNNPKNNILKPSITEVYKGGFK